MGNGVLRSMSFRAAMRFEGTPRSAKERVDTGVLTVRGCLTVVVAKAAVAASVRRKKRTGKWSRAEIGESGARVPYDGAGRHRPACSSA